MLHRLRLPLVLALCALLAAGCRIELTTSMVVRADGSGSIALAIDLDAAAVAELEDLRVDPFAEVAAVVVATPGWELRRESLDDGGLRVVLEHTAADAQALTEALRELTADLAEEDPALLIDLDIEVDDAGAARLDGTAWLRPPATAGAVQDDVPIGPHGDDLAALVADHVDAHLEVTLPGSATDHDADEVTEAGDALPFVAGPQTLRWDLPTDAARPVAAAADPPGGIPAWSLWAAAGLLALLVVGILAWWWRRH